MRKRPCKVNDSSDLSSHCATIPCNSSSSSIFIWISSVWETDHIGEFCKNLQDLFQHKKSGKLSAATLYIYANIFNLKSKPWEYNKIPILDLDPWSWSLSVLAISFKGLGPVWNTWTWMSVELDFRMDISDQTDKKQFQLKYWTLNWKYNSRRSLYWVFLSWWSLSILRRGDVYWETSKVCSFRDREKTNFKDANPWNWNQTQQDSLSLTKGQAELSFIHKFYWESLVQNITF